MKSAVLSAALVLTPNVFAAPLKVEQAIVICAQKTTIIAPGEKLNCFSLLDVDGTFNLVEIHNKECGGDPQTLHTRAFFSIQNGKLGYEYGAEDWKACP